MLEGPSFQKCTMIEVEAKALSQIKAADLIQDNVHVKFLYRMFVAYSTFVVLAKEATGPWDATVRRLQYKARTSRRPSML